MQQVVGKNGEQKAGIRQDIREVMGGMGKKWEEIKTCDTLAVILGLMYTRKLSTYWSN